MDFEDDLAGQFDDWELRAEDKGKRPVEEEEEEEQASSSESEGEEEEGERGPRRSGAGAAAAASDSIDVGAASGTCEGDGAAAPGSRGLGSAAVSEAGDMTCAICLGGIPLENLALVKGCDHMYCATCILHWALHKEEPWCPQCKQPFTYLLTYRTLDGELQDFPSEESVCLLKRACWFEEHLRFEDRKLLEESKMAEHLGWQEDFDLEDEEELESYYFSSAAGRARVVLGNRRYGEGGFISGGRRQARPIVERKRSNKMGKSGEHAVVGTAPMPPARFSTPNAGGGRSGGKARPGSGSGADASGSRASSSSTPVPVAPAELYSSSPAASSGPGGSTGGIYGSSPSGSGRRARRNARRAAMDAGLEAAVATFGGRGRGN